MDRRTRLAKLGMIFSIGIASIGWLSADYNYEPGSTAYACQPNYRSYSFKTCIDKHHILLRSGEVTARYNRMVGYWEEDVRKLRLEGRYDYPERPSVEWETEPIWLSVRHLFVFCIALFCLSMGAIVTRRQSV